ncbi:cell number regulator 8 [Juglans microcarpa x Juglans regia]|uniref:cell number regulator 8 n=1 Tax=Juglans microcarpa x Juglans regia TaxID=2249226 RepID=UPI001B7EA1CA|nr:cell number regulator 8 [Juglans microcarpa x Juglans regia]
MADNINNNVNYEESSPLLSKQVVEGVEDDAKKASKPIDAEDEKVTVSPAAKTPAPVSGNFGGHGWTANGLPLGHGSVVGEPMGRTQWNSSIFACLGRNDEFCSSDLEVCLLGSVAPCVLYGGNVERLGSSPGTFGNHCLSYSGLYLIGNSIFGGNFLAPWFSYTSRTAIRRMFNLEGSCEALHRSCGCCGSFLEDEVQREQCESACDFATHVFCHVCALCQEGRELRRRLPHPGFNAQPFLVMIPPGEQTMGRAA